MRYGKGREGQGRVAAREYAVFCEGVFGLCKGFAHKIPDLDIIW
jgi:hypothetical protein